MNASVSDFTVGLNFGVHLSVVLSALTWLMDSGGSLDKISSLVIVVNEGLDFLAEFGTGFSSVVYLLIPPGEAAIRGEG